MRYVQTLAERGEQVDVIALRRQGRPWRESVASVHLYQIQRRDTTEKRPWTYLFKTLWFWLKSMLLTTVLQIRRRYHVVHVHNVPDFLVFGAWLPKLMGARVILDIHDIVPELYAGKFQPYSFIGSFSVAHFDRACLLLFADHVIVSNDFWRDKLTSRSVRASKCTTILDDPAF